MTLDADKVAALARAQVKSASPDAARRLRRLLVAPRLEQRPWDYGARGAAFPCWIVAEHRPSDTVFAYCEHGHGLELVRLARGGVPGILGLGGQQVDGHV